MKFLVKLLFSVSLLAVLCTACNKGAGEGGTATVQGFVKLVQHPDDDYSLPVDTVAAAKTDVFIVYGDDEFYGDDVKTGPDGFYRFSFLRPGNYTVFAYSTLISGEKVAVSERVDVKAGQVATVPAICVHEGKAYGTSVVMGKVYAAYFHNGNYRGEGWAIEHRVYIRRAGESLFFDDTRVGPDGTFAFQKLVPGDYEVFTATESLDEIPEFVFKSVKVDEAGKVYELDEPFNVIINV